MNNTIRQIINYHQQQACRLSRNKNQLFFAGLVEHHRSSMQFFLQLKRSLDGKKES